MSTLGRDRRFDLSAYSLAALEWGAGEPVLALHGWLDNAGSFNLLAPRLAGCHVIALDSAGHGLSGSRSPDASYNIWQEVGDVLDVADQLGWERFSLLGHSRGAAVSTLFAGAFPDRVKRMVYIDGGLPILGQSEEAPENLARSLTDARRLRTRQGRVFPTREAAIAERMDGFTSVNADAAAQLAERSLRALEGGGWQWVSDQRLKARSEVRLNAEMVRAFIQKVSAPVLAFEASGGPFAGRADFVELIPLFSKLEIERLDGGHHLHLEGGEIAIAARALPFLASSSSRGS